MTREADPYTQFAEHPRYGRRPHVTGLNPQPGDPGVHLHWNTTTVREVAAQFEAMMGKRWPYGDLWDHSQQIRRIPHTAIPADLDRQTPATVQVTHYFDLERRCRDCGRPFIFFAREQQYWYEQLGFGLDSDCVRCVDCRKQQQGIARYREIYESLFHVAERTPERSLQMADACLSLIEHGVFSHRQLQRVRRLLKAVAEHAEPRLLSRCRNLRQRLEAVECPGSE